ncbi:MAG: DNA polymerase I, partial [Herbinix sp.]|nr:DNA polymerase I [Herbinix sp.]
ERLRELLFRNGMQQLFETIEMPLIYSLYDMEVRGIKVNKEALKEYGDNLQVGIEKLEKNIYELVGEEFNINSPKQLGVILFDKLKLPFGKKTKTGYSTSADILEKLRSEHPAVKMILEYRQLTKLKSTYADGLAGYIGADGRIHGRFHQTITATGRISSTEPNLQNIPIRMELGRQIRKVFIPEQDFVFLDADYSQIELRVLAHMSGDERLINAYKEAKDIHRITASEVFHIPFEEVTPAQRSSAKAVNFGIVYGISSFGLGQDLNITRKEAERYIEKYFDTYPKVKSYLDRLVADAKEDGFCTTLFGRRRPIPELASSNFMQRSFGERVAMNSPIQGTAADIIKIAMIKVNQRLKEGHFRSRLILQIHDELLVETHKDEVSQVARIMVEEMQGAAELSVLLEAEVKEGSNWFEAK